MANKAAQSLGRKGGKARMKKMTKEQRSAIARKAAQAMWAKRRKYEQEIKKSNEKIVKQFKIKPLICKNS